MSDTTKAWNATRRDVLEKQLAIALEKGIAKGRADGNEEGYMIGLVAGLKRGRADALREAADVARQWGAQGRAIAQQIEALAQKPQPERSCGNCRFEDDIEFVCIKWCNASRIAFQPKEGT